MRPETEKARRLLEESNSTLVLCSADETITSFERGVRGLLKLADEKKDLSGFCAADKAVGKGAAVLFVLLGVKEVFTAVISESAKNLLSQNGVTVFASQTVEVILNRKGDGVCPIEQALGGTDEPESALGIIRETLRSIG